MSEGATATCRSLWDHLGQGVRIKSTVNRSPCTALVSCNFKPSIVQFLSIFRHQTIPSPAALLFFSTGSSSSREKSTTRAKLRFETTFQPSNRILIGIRARYAAPNSAYRCVHRVHFRVSDTFAIDPENFFALTISKLYGLFSSTSRSSVRVHVHTA